MAWERVRRADDPAAEAAAVVAEGVAARAELPPAELLSLCVEANTAKFEQNSWLADELRATVAIGETVILLTSPLPLVGVSIVMERGCQQNDSLADG